MKYYGVKRKRSFSAFSIIAFSLFFISTLLVWISKASTGFADFMNETVCNYFRFLMARIGGLFPFSLYEVIMLSIPLIAVFIIVLAVRRFKSGRGRLRFCINLLSVILLLISGHNIALGIGYNTTSLDKRMGFDTVEVTEERLADVMISLRDEVNLLSEQISFAEDGTSDPCMSFREMSDKLVESYGSFDERHGFPGNYYSYAKRVRFGNLMSYLGITGIYTYYTGDANVNSAYPSYDIAFTTAHELAHQRGIMRENEANFMAYLVTSTSDDPYLCYSGALNMYQYIGNALYKTNKELYREINSGLCDGAKSDIIASYAVSEKYGDTFIADISNFINDMFLKSNGTAGVVTYGRVVSLTVAYFENSQNRVK